MSTTAQSGRRVSGPDGRVVVGAGSEATSAAVIRFVAGMLVAAGLILTIVLTTDPSVTLARAAVNLFVSAVGVIAWNLERRSRPRAAAHVIVWGVWAIITALAWRNGGLSAPNLLTYPVLVMVSGWLLGGRATLWLWGLTTITLVGFYIAGANGQLPVPPAFRPMIQVVFVPFILLLAAGVMTLSRRSYRERLEEIAGAHRALEEQAVALRKVSEAVAQSPESVIITDLAPSIEYVNDAFVRATGYDRSESIGRNPRFLQSGDTPKETHVAMWASLSAGQPWQGEFVNRRKDGAKVVHAAVVAPIRQADGRITHYVANMVDVTDKKALERELDEHRRNLEALVRRRTDELDHAVAEADRANHAKSAFLASMSHEIRTPLNAIIGLTYLLSRKGATPAQVERLDKIAVAGRHLLAIVSGVLDLAKIEAGKVELATEDFSVPALLEQVRALILVQIESRPIDVQVELDGVPPLLHGDPTRLQQALLNYAGNAAKFTEQGSIWLRASLDADHGDVVDIRFEVTDTGPGIPADKLARLFEPFEQGGGDADRDQRGTGLGLAITRRLAELMGGAAGAQSEHGRGSTFWFTARLGRTGSAGSASEAAPAGATDRGTP